MMEDSGVMADGDPVVRLASGPVASVATAAAYERLVTAKEAEIARLRAEVEHLTRQLRSQQMSLRQAEALIAFLCERAAEQGGRPTAEKPAPVPLVPPTAWEHRPSQTGMGATAAPMPDEGA